MKRKRKRTRKKKREKERKRERDRERDREREKGSGRKREGERERKREMPGKKVITLTIKSMTKSRQETIILASSMILLDIVGATIKFIASKIL